MKRQGFTLAEVMVASTLVLLLVVGGSAALHSFARTLRSLQEEGQELARVAHAIEGLQRQILRSQPLVCGEHRLDSGPLQLRPLESPLNESMAVALENGWVHWEGRAQGPAEAVLIAVREEHGRRLVEINWSLSGNSGNLVTTFDATVLP